MIITQLLLAIAIQQGTPSTSLSAETLIDLADTLYSTTERPVFLGSPLNEYRFEMTQSEEQSESKASKAQFEIKPSQEQLGGMSFKDYVIKEWPKHFKDGPILGSPVEPAKPIIVSKPRYLMPYHGIANLLLVGYRFDGKHSNQRVILPSTPLSDFTFNKDGTVTLSSAKPAHLKAENFVQKTWDRPIKFHWFIGQVWVVMKFDTLSREAFLQSLADSIGGKVVTKEDHDYIDLDIDNMRRVWKETYARIAIPSDEERYEGWGKFVETQVRLKSTTLDEYSDADIANAMSKPDGLVHKVIDSQATAHAVMRDYVRAVLTRPVETAWAETDQRFFKANLMEVIDWNAQWYNSIKFPSINYEVKLRGNGLVPF